MNLEATTAEDAAALAELHASAFDDAWSAAYIAGLIGGAGAFGLAAREGGQTAGFVLCRTIVDESEILTLATAPAWRRRGVARGLVAAVVESARAQGAATLFLEVAEDNQPAIALYAGMGFERIGHRARYYSRPRGPIGALVMRRDLNR